MNGHLARPVALDPAHKTQMEMPMALFIHDAREIEDRTNPQSRWLIPLFAVIARAGSVVQAELRARRDAAELASLDDRMLCDMGVSRSEIQRLVRRL